MGKKRKHEDNEEETFDLPKKHLIVGHQQNQEKRLIVVLERANLESVKVRFFKCYVLQFGLFV